MCSQASMEEAWNQGGEGKIISGSMMGTKNVIQYLKVNLGTFVALSKCVRARLPVVSCLSSCAVC